MEEVNRMDPSLIKVYYDSSVSLTEECDLYVSKRKKKITDDDLYCLILTTPQREDQDAFLKEVRICKKHTPLFQIAFYERELLTSQYDNRLIRHADPNAQIPSYALFYQDLFDDVDNEIIPIVHVFIDADFSDIPSRFSRITSSSIWNYCIHFDTSNGDDEHLFEYLSAVKASIIHNKKLGLYDLAIAQEYADLNARLTKQAFISFGYGKLREKLLKEPSDGKGGNHGDRIAPFLFHSEREMKEKLKTENFDGQLHKLIKTYKWRFLLVDDKIDKNSKDGKGVLSSSDDNAKITKCKILEDRINSIFCESQNESSRITCKSFIYKSPAKDESWKNDDYPEDILIVCVENTEDAKTLMMKYEFDIILLDYLLGEITKDNDIIQEYGYSILKDLHDSCELSDDKVQKLRNIGYKVGPQGKFFFMFISAFTTAISERLNVLGLSRNEDIWEIGEGACPTNTPELFKYRLVHLMERRLAQTGIKDLSDKSVIATVRQIFAPKSGQEEQHTERIRTVREQAYQNYNKILGFHYDYLLMRHNDKEYSRLVGSFIKKKVHLGAMLEHLLQLVHLTAFGTVRQWPEIWEEYKYFVRAVNVSDEDGENRKILSSLSNDIEKHIIDLKSE